MRPTPRLWLAALSFVLFATIARAHAPATDMLAAAEKFLAALSPEQKTRATYPLSDAQREKWFFIPIERGGLPFKAMSPSQHDLALDLLRTGLSPSGFSRAESIMSLENVLKELEHGAAHRDPTLYYVTIFATPSATQSWGWRFEGHHLSFNFTIVDGTDLFVTPSFIGSNPGEVRSGPKQGLRVLGAEDDLGRALFKSLDPTQRGSALIATKAPNEIFTSNRPRVEPLTPAGLPAAQMTPAQRDQLGALLALYFNRYRVEIAQAAQAEFTAADVDKVFFAWAGGSEPGEGHYYRLQSPTFLIEFDNTQNDANHIHTVWRSFKGDFGPDVLREHYAKEHRSN